MLLLSRRVEYTIIWHSVFNMTWSGKVMFDISRSTSSTWTHLRRFRRSGLYLSKISAEKLMVTFHDLRWPRGHEEVPEGHWLQFSGSGCQAYLYLYVWECFEWPVVQKKRLLILSHWFIMGRLQNWHDLKSHISKFRDIHFIDIVTCIKLGKFQGDCSVGIAMTNIQTFS